MNLPSWFDQTREQSVIKAEIVSKYFWSWANIMKRQSRSGRIAYIDLFAGPGRYQDGTKSTPLMVLEKAIGSDDLCDCLVSLFNDFDSNCVRSLEESINGLEGIDKLKHTPQINNAEVGAEIVEMFESMSLVPTFFFVDPWGYKGLSLRLINSVLKDWGCDCVFFLNYNRISMGVGNDKVGPHIDALFGEERASELRVQVKGMKPYLREMTIVNELAEALREYGGRYVLPFCFKDEYGTRTSHHLVFVSKHVLGYEIMKQIMAGYSSEQPQGVPSFAYNPVTDSKLKLLFDLSRPLDELEGMLAEEFKGQTMTMKQVYDRHHVDRPFIAKNYKDVLRTMEEKGLIVADQPAEKRRKLRGVVTFADKVKVTFL